MGRCIVHFAVDDAEVAFCTHLTGKSSWFLPFNQGWNSGAGNPPNPSGLKTDYLWKQVLARESLANIIENFAQVVEEDDERDRKKRKQVFPRFHQLRSVRALLRRTQQEGVGRRYLVQHSAGSGKSNTIAWLAHQLVELRTAGDAHLAQFDSVIVITDRRALDTQISRTIKSYDHVAAIFGHSDSADELRGFLRQGKKIIITTVQKFPFILDELGDLGTKRFALLIDEAHSSQGGKTTAKMHMALSAASGEDEDDEESVEDAVNRLITSRKMLPNASYFAFTATPKNRTLELFGERYTEADEVHFRSPSELTYTTKQAIQEGFILDVIKNYTPVDSFYRVAKTVEDDPDFDKVRALKKIRHYVESHDKAIRSKAEIMVDHFIAQVAGKRKIGGQARAMIVCRGIARAIDYFREVSDYLTEIKSPYKAIVAYSGDFEIGGIKKSEADLNDFPSKDISAKLKRDPYRFLIVANKFVIGFDEPLLHTMYVDKPLAGVLAVQTLSRLNRAHPQKYDTFVLDFADNAEAVKDGFQDYYRATIQVGETAPNKLHDLKNDLDAPQVYAWLQVEQLVALFITGAERDQLDPILDACVEVYKDALNEDQQVEFKGKAKAFVRSYGFLGAILPYGYTTWEKLSIFLNFLIPKLPAPKEQDLSKGVLDAIDMDSYRPEVKAALSLALDDADGEVEPAPTGGIGGGGDPDIDKLSNIIKAFNDLFGNIDWKDGDKIRQVIAEDIPNRVAQDRAYQNAVLHSDKQNAKLEHDKALNRVVLELLADHTELFKQFSDNPNFKRWLTDTVFDSTYRAGMMPSKVPPQVGTGAR
jgi:type I restriction enzyme R subunit